MASGPEVTVERRLEWHDTDAAGHHHHSVILRWAEDAEAELLRGLGVQWLFGRTPRVRYEVDYKARLWFGDPASVRLWVAAVGTTSLTFRFEVTGPAGVVAAGSVVIVHALPDGAATPWPAEVRAALGPVADHPGDSVAR
ncbi:MAG TPA: thioesterase family protein [Pseudonocardiaceae bacterium]|jgi:acyl-CoA thioester hydrolase|nr:thioesterase family protein [Pseudonocardiaceae bacterium]